MGGTSRKRMCVLFCGGVVLLATGGIMIPVVDMIIRDKIKDTVKIRNTSEVWDIWSEMPVPVYMQFYMFNLSNPEEVKQGGRPVVYQKGPYTYREKRKKYDIVFNSNGTVTYRQKRTFFFMRNMSVGADTDLFTTANPPVLAVVNSLQYAPPAVRTIVNGALRTYGEDIFMTRPVKELLWGYTDPALKTLMKIYPEWFYTDFVGYFMNKNDTDDGLYTVFTGENDISVLGVIDQYNGSKLLPYWTTTSANMVNGSDGTIAPPFQQGAKQLPMFSSDICRSIYGVLQGNVKTLHDISLQRYIGSAQELANATANPDNLGFCTPQTKCLPTGLLNISNCQTVDYFHIPVVVSYPHFLMADPSVIKSIGGMHPVQEEHQVAVDVEPWTGLVLQAFKRLQINMFLTQVEFVGITQKIRTMYLPVFWLNESAVVDDKHASMLQRQLFAPMEIVSVLEKVFMIVGGALILLVMVITCRNHKRSDSRSIPPGPVPTLSNNGLRRRPPTTQRERERQPLLKDRLNRPSNSEFLPAPPPASNGHASATAVDSTDPTYHSPTEA